MTSSTQWAVLFDVRHADYQGLYFPLAGILLWQGALTPAILTASARSLDCARLHPVLDGLFRSSP